MSNEEKEKREERRVEREATRSSPVSHSEVRVRASRYWSAERGAPSECATHTHQHQHQQGTARATSWLVLVPGLQKHYQTTPKPAAVRSDGDGLGCS
jgi:hypothetical protein